MPAECKWRFGSGTEASDWAANGIGGRTRRESNKELSAVIDVFAIDSTGMRT
jgi:hypothetical protein